MNNVSENSNTVCGKSCLSTTSSKLTYDKLCLSSLSKELFGKSDRIEETKELINKFVQIHSSTTDSVSVSRL